MPTQNVGQRTLKTNVGTQELKLQAQQRGRAAGLETIMAIDTGTRDDRKWDKRPSKVGTPGRPREAQMSAIF